MSLGKRLVLTVLWFALVMKVVFAFTPAEHSSISIHSPSLTADNLQETVVRVSWPVTAIALLPLTWVIASRAWRSLKSR